MAIQFNPNFKHTDWVDNLDRVQAGGNNGFNIRFQGLLSDMAALSDVIGQINNGLVGLATPPSQATVTRTFGPALLPQNDPSLPNSGTPTQNLGWAHQSGVTFLPSKQTAADGMMPVNLPDKAVIQALRVYGKNSGNGTILVRLVAQSFSDISSQPIATVTVPGQAAFGVASKASTTNSVNIVRADTFHYFLDAAVGGATVGDTVQIISFQIDYLPA